MSQICEAELAELEHGAEESGVVLRVWLSADERGNRFIWLDLIERVSGEPGSGRQALRRLCERADQLRLPIRAAVLSWNSALLDYYAEECFLVAVEADPDELEDHSLIDRRPR